MNVKFLSLTFAIAFVMGLFVLPGAFGFIEVEVPTFEDNDFAGTTAMENMTEDITALITQIIPVFVTIGVFGVIIGMISGMMKKFGQ